MIADPCTGWGLAGETSEAKQPSSYSHRIENTRRAYRGSGSCRLSLYCPKIVTTQFSTNTHMTRLTRKQIEEGLKATPIEQILLGVAGAKDTRLTAKQKAFAEEVAKGNTKAGAYRKAYNSKGKPKTQSENGQKLVKNEAIQRQIEAYQVALEAQKYTTPAHLRALTIHKLTEKALDPDIAPAQQIKALELLGKITEVALFTERREIIQTSNSSEIRAKLLSSIRLALSTQNAETIEPNQADDLLAELSGVHPDDAQTPDHDQPDIDQDAQQINECPPDPFLNQKTATPPDPTSQFLPDGTTPAMHAIPHTESQLNSANEPLTTSGVTPVTGENVINSTACVSSSSNPILSKGEGA